MDNGESFLLSFPYISKDLFDLKIEGSHLVVLYSLFYKLRMHLVNQTKSLYTPIVRILFVAYSLCMTSIGYAEILITI